MSQTQFRCQGSFKEKKKGILGPSFCHASVIIPRLAYASFLRNCTVYFPLRNAVSRHECTRYLGPRSTRECGDYVKKARHRGDDYCCVAKKTPQIRPRFLKCMQLLFGSIPNGRKQTNKGAHFIVHTLRPSAPTDSKIFCKHFT